MEPRREGHRGLVAYHEAHLDDFMWDDRLDVAIYTCEDADIAKKVRKALRKSGDVETLRRELISERPLALRAETGLPKERTRGPTALLRRWPTVP